jgi:hypothetical protein
MADILTDSRPEFLTQDPVGASGDAAKTVPATAGAEASRYSRTGDMIKARMPDLVKGAGFAPKGGNMPLTDLSDITTRASQATLDLRTETWRGYNARADVVQKGFRADFLNQFGYLKTALSAPSLMEQIGALVGGMPGGAEALKSWTAGNLGIGSVS